MIKKILCSTIAVIGTVGAHSAIAQSQVTVYGLIDTGVVYTTNANDKGDSVTKMPGVTGSFPSRIGFRGAEDLGGGLQAIFTLENGFSPDTGTTGQGGRLFGRQAYVGLKNSWGQVTLGRLFNMSFAALGKTDVMGPNIFSVGSIDGYFPNARSDNAIGYMGNFSGVTVGATYSFGRDASNVGGPAGTACGGEVAGNAKACRQVTALLGYDNSKFGVYSSYDIMYGNTTANDGLNSSDKSDQRFTLSAYSMLGATKVGAGIIERRKSAAVDYKTRLWFLGASYPISPSLVLDGQVARFKEKNSDNSATLLVARLTYNLSKRTSVYTSIGQMNNSGKAKFALDAGGTAGTGLNQRGIVAGLKHSF